MTTLHQSTTIVTARTQGSDPLDAFDLPFDLAEQADKPVIELPRLIWLNGLATDAETLAVGWHIKAGVDPYLDETMHGMGVAQYRVHHQRPDKDGKTDPKAYWHLRSCSLIIVAKKIQSPLEMRILEDRAGVAYGWETVRDEQGQPVQGKGGREKKQTVLKLRAFVHELYRHGYYQWLPLTLTGFVTDALLSALSEHYRVLDYYGDLRRAQGKNPIAPYYLFSLPLGPGKVKHVGDPPNQGKIYPPEAKLPQVLSKDYLQEHLVEMELIELIRSELLVETVQWSIQESLKIAGASPEPHPALPGPATSLEHTSHQEPVPAGDPAPSDDPAVQPPQISWIQRQYCGNRPEAIQGVCQRFAVADLAALRMSHFRLLVKDVQTTHHQPAEQA